MARLDIELDPFNSFEKWHWDRFGYGPISQEKEPRVIVAETELRGHERFLTEPFVSKPQNEPNPDFFEPIY